MEASAVQIEQHERTVGVEVEMATALERSDTGGPGCPTLIRTSRLCGVEDPTMVVRHGDDGLFVREEQPFITVTLRLGDRVNARLPTMRESAVLGIPRHVPLLVVTRASGRTERYTGATTRLAAGD
jgi:hypothetical protein